jgi:homoaconitate hydratase family protein
MKGMATEMGTLTEEIFSRKLGRAVKAGEIVWCTVDHIMSHDTMTVLAIEAFRQLADRVFEPERIVIPFDHVVPPANMEQASCQRQIMGFIEEQGIRNFFQEGVCHQVMVEKGFAIPGDVVIGSDSHTCTYGALGCFSTGMGSTDIGVAYATGGTWFRIPETFNIHVCGKMPKGVYAKDLIHTIISRTGVEGANYMAVEFTGDTIEGLEIHERLTIANMAIELGGKAGLVASDEKTATFIRGISGSNGKTAAADLKIMAVNPTYKKRLVINAEELVPVVACPHDLDNLKPASELSGVKIDEVFIGTCTNGRYEDLEIAAGIMKGRKVSRYTRTIVIPASKEIYLKAMDNGLIRIFMEAGAIVCNPGCGPCLGRHQGVLAAGEKAMTTMNRNFRGRMGSPEAEIYSGSPATAAATAINGRITDPRERL